MVVVQIRLLFVPAMAVLLKAMAIQSLTLLMDADSIGLDTITYGALTYCSSWQ